VAGPRAEAEPVPGGSALAGGGPVSVLLAEHEPEVAEMSVRYLRRDGLGVRLVTSPELALAELSDGPDAAAVIDLTMPGLDSRRIRRALRTPVIFLTAGSGVPRPRGLATAGPAAGARRWLARPFSPRQLVATVRDVLAPGGWTFLPPQTPPTGGTHPSTPLFGKLRLDGARRAVVADGHHVPLTASEFAVLAFMMDHPGRVLSRRQLLAAAGRQAAGNRAADVYIAQLRAKIGSDPRTGVIRTVRGAGYALDR
jgi:two-component system, OmpR family, response regulator MtrA